MKKTIISFVLSFFGLIAFAQETIYFENMGTITDDNTPVLGHTFQNSTVTYTAITTPENASFKARLRNVIPSEGYTDASGGACIFIPSSVEYVISFLIEGINTMGYQDIVLSLGHYKGTNAASNQLMIEVSENGTDWTALSYTRPTGPETSSWILINPTGTIPATENLRIRFTNDGANADLVVGFRIDDLKLTGTESSSVGNLNKSEIKLFPNPVTNGIVSIFTNDNSVVKVEIFDILGKKVLDKTTTDNTLNVSNLNSGVYLIKLTTPEKSITQKLVIK